MATSPKVLLLIEKAKAAHAARQAEKAAAATQLSQAKQIAQDTQSPQATPPANTAKPLALAADTYSALTPQSNILTSMAVYGLSAATQLATQPTTQTTELSLNAEQAEAVERGLRGQNFVLIGAAGTGKTTATQKLVELAQRASHMLPISVSTKHLTKDSPGILVTGFTNKAVNNLKKRLPDKLQSHCLTMHKMTEFAPEYFDIVDEHGNMKTSMRFAPTYHGGNPLPHISTIIFEESSMIGIDLYGQVIDALPQPQATQTIFLGDIFQLPPVFGPSILGFKLSELPVVELKHVYRQALLSPIISLATAIRTNTFTPWLVEQTGKATLTELVTIDAKEHGKVTIHPWKKRIAATSALKTVSHMICNLIESGKYDPDVDQILCPFNKAFGTIELNKHLADYLTKKRDAVTYEVIARFNRTYWAVGDRVLVDRHDAIITSITPAIGYQGKPTVAPSKTLNRNGFDSVLDVGRDKERSAEDILNELDNLAMSDEDTTKRASHVIKVFIPDLDKEIELSTSAEINNMLLSYVLTVHKSQGSEWRRLFIFLHHTHQTMCSRELLYTAVTRAKEELYIVCEGDIAPYKNQLLTGSNRAIIPGITLAEKIEYFKGKRASMQSLD